MSARRMTFRVALGRSVALRPGLRSRRVAWGAGSGCRSGRAVVGIASTRTRRVAGARMIGAAASRAGIVSSASRMVVTGSASRVVVPGSASRAVIVACSSGPVEVVCSARAIEVVRPTGVVVPGVGAMVEAGRVVVRRMHGHVAVIGARRRVAVEAAVISVVYDGYAAGNVGVVLVKDGVIAPAYAPVMPSPSPVIPQADGDPYAEADCQSDAEPITEWRCGNVVPGPGYHRTTIDSPGVVVGHVNHCRIGR